MNHRSEGGEPFYRYIPRRALIVDSLFIAVLTAAGVLFQRHGIWPMAVVMGIVILNTLINLVQESVIELRSEFPDLIYTRRSLFRKNTVRIPFREVKGATTHITSMWKGNISEKMVLETSGREFLLHPHFSAGDPAAAGIHRKLTGLIGQANKFREETSIRQHPRGKTEHRQKKVGKLVWGMVEMSIKCPRCETTVPVNGPWNLLHCPECSEAIDLSPDNWADLLEGVRNETAGEIKPGMGRESTVIGVFQAHLLYSRMPPYCRECREDLPLPEPGARMLRCSCGETLPVAEPPEWFDRVYSGARYIIGATRSTKVSEQEPEQVFITCPSCGSSFESAGESRNPSCPNCDTCVFLPDDLWFHFHPAPVRKRWFVGFLAKR